MRHEAVETRNPGDPNPGDPGELSSDGVDETYLDRRQMHAAAPIALRFAFGTLPIAIACSYRSTICEIAFFLGGGCGHVDQIHIMR